MRRLLQVCFIALTTLLLISCGGGGGGQDPAAESVNVGVFIDSPVSGIAYSTPTRSGVTNGQGEFQYLDNEAVTFSIGGISLGQSSGQAIITPVDLIQGAIDYNHPSVINILRLLQTLDDDANPDNGIVIPASVLASAVGVQIDVQVSVEIFAANTDLDNLIQASTQQTALVDTTEALQHFQLSLADIEGVSLYSVGGNVTGLSGSITLSNNGQEQLEISSNGSFSFIGLVEQGNSYDVSIQTQPVGQTCSIVNSGPNNITQNISDVTINCVDITYTVGANAGSGGVITPLISTIAHGNTASFILTPDIGYAIDSVSGCGGSLLGSTFTTSAITADCVVSASFILSYTVSSSAGANGSISPASIIVNLGSTGSFTVTPDSGYRIDSVSGCAGSLLGNTYTTGVITADCAISASFSLDPAIPALTFTQVKVFKFTWADNPVATHYKLFEDPDGSSGFTQVGADIPQGAGNYEHIVPLYARANARYILQTCNAAIGCIDSSTILVSGAIAGSIGYIKASNTGNRDRFGSSVSLSGDGNTMAVGATGEWSNATGINGDQLDNSLLNAGAVYVFVKSGSTWVQQAYIKPSTPGFSLGLGIYEFGASVSLSLDGNTLAVGARGERAVYVFKRTGDAWAQQAEFSAVDNRVPSGRPSYFGSSLSLSDDGNTLAVGSDANFAYIYTRSGEAWSQQVILEGEVSVVGTPDGFGRVVSLSSDGNTLAVGAGFEDSDATGINGDETNDRANDSGAVYIFVRSGTSWLREAFIKGHNTNMSDRFGETIGLSQNGDTLVVGAPFSSDVSFPGSPGAVYVFYRNGTLWSQEAYIKANYVWAGSYFGFRIGLSADGNTLAVPVGNVLEIYQRNLLSWDFLSDIRNYSGNFGSSISLGADGNTLAVGASYETSNAVGVGGDQTDTSLLEAGAVFLY